MLLAVLLRGVYVVLQPLLPFLEPIIFGFVFCRCKSCCYVLMFFVVVAAAAVSAVADVFSQSVAHCDEKPASCYYGTVPAYPKQSI